MRLLRPSRDEHGIAMITAILVSGVVLTLSITATSLAIHNTNASGLDRKRVQVIATAEAGVDAAFSVLQTTPTAALPCQIQATLQGAPAQQYTANITYYDLAGSPSACTGPSQG